MWRYDDLDLWITFGNDAVGRITVIGTVGRDLTNFMFDLVNQWVNLGWVIDVLLGQHRGDYQPRFGVHRKVPPSPVTA